MNKAELIDALAARLGDKKTASSALDVSSSEPFSEGLALVGKGKLRMTHGYANREGKVVIPHQYRFAQSFSEGLAAVKIARLSDLSTSSQLAM